MASVPRHSIRSAMTSPSGPRWCLGSEFREKKVVGKDDEEENFSSSSSLRSGSIQTFKLIYFNRSLHFARSHSAGHRPHSSRWSFASSSSRFRIIFFTMPMDSRAAFFSASFSWIDLRASFFLFNDVPFPSRSLFTSFREKFNHVFVSGAMLLVIIPGYCKWSCRAHRCSSEQIIYLFTAHRPIVFVSRLSVNFRMSQ